MWFVSKTIIRDSNSPNPTMVTVKFPPLENNRMNNALLDWGVVVVDGGEDVIVDRRDNCG